ncbi:transposase, partial [Mycobacterium kansasii]
NPVLALLLNRRLIYFNVSHRLDREGNRENGVTIEQIAADFGVHPITLSKWMRQADVDDGAKPGTTTNESAELREARRRIKLLEQENEVLRRAAAYLSQSNLPGKGFTRS